VVYQGRIKKRDEDFTKKLRERRGGGEDGADDVIRWEEGTGPYPEIYYIY